MKYFAKLNETNTVIDVVCINDNDAPTEADGIVFLINLYNHEYWKQSFKDRNQRKNGAGIGFTYDETRDAFIPIKPYSSWILNETTCDWEAPIEEPNDGNKYIWNESTTTWDILDTEEDLEIIDNP
tara:strand:+ start:151 stop:528 length:378 start_codon:yes stop_codon:yes gene_type:complete